MIRTIIWLILAVLILIVYLPALLIVWFTRDKSPDAKPSEAIQKVCSTFLPLAAWVAGAKLHVSGTENIPDETVMFAGNHQGDFDVLPAVYCINRAKSIVIKQEVMKLPIVRLYLKLFRCIPMDRDNIRKSLESMIQVRKHFENGISVLIFPEGTRSRGPEMGEFKPGAFKAAVKAGVPIVPFVIDGTYKCYEENKRITPSDVYFKVLKPVYPEEYTQWTTAELSEEIKARIQAELDIIRA